MALVFIPSLMRSLTQQQDRVTIEGKTLRQVVTKRRFRNQLITEGMVMLVSKKTPTYIQDRLNSFLQVECHNYLEHVKIDIKPVVQPWHLKVAGT